MNITTEEKKSFVDYCLMFYGKGQIYGQRGYATEEQIVAATDIYLTRGDDIYFHEGEHLWGGGDTVDRETVAEILVNEFRIDLY